MACDRDAAGKVMTASRAPGTRSEGPTAGAATGTRPVEEPPGSSCGPASRRRCPRMSPPHGRRGRRGYDSTWLGIRHSRRRAGGDRRSGAERTGAGWYVWGSWGGPGRGRVQICHKDAPDRDRPRTKARNINDSLSAFRRDQSLCSRFGQPAPPPIPRQPVPVMSQGMGDGLDRPGCGGGSESMEG